MSYSLNCIRSNMYDYHDRCEPRDVNKCCLDKPTLRPSNELFAFNFFELPENIQDKVLRHIRNRFGLDLEDTKTALNIFKVLVARDFDMKLAYIENNIKDEKDAKPVKVHSVKYNPDKFHYDYITSEFKEKYKTKATYRIMSPHLHQWNHCFLNENDDYIQLKDSSFILDGCWSNGLTKEQERNYPYIYSDFYKALYETRIRNINILETYLFVKHKESENKYYKMLIKDIDLTKTKPTIRFLKKDWMMSPQDMDGSRSCYDNELVKIINKYKLSTETDQEFIDWILNGCEDKVEHVTENNYASIKNKFDWPYMSRGNCVELFHGVDDVDELRVGTVFKSGASKYIVIGKGGHDPDDNARAVVKYGTTMKGKTVNQDNIIFVCDAGIIEESWDCLFDVNRIGKRKKFFKNIQIISK